MEPSNEVKIARLEAHMDTMRGDVADIKTDQKTQIAKLDALLAAEHERRGVRRFGRTLVQVGTGSGFLAAVAWVWEHLTK